MGRGRIETGIEAETEVGRERIGIGAGTGMGVEIMIEEEADQETRKWTEKRKRMTLKRWILMDKLMEKKMIQKLKGNLLKMRTIVKIKVRKMVPGKMDKKRPNPEDLLEILEAGLEKNLKKRRIMRKKKNRKKLKSRRRMKALLRKEIIGVIERTQLILMLILKEEKRKSPGLELKIEDALVRRDQGLVH